MKSLQPRPAATLEEALLEAAAFDDAAGPVTSDRYLELWMKDHMPGLHANLMASGPFRAYLLGHVDGREYAREEQQ